MTDFDFNSNEDTMRLAVDELKAKLQKVYLGGGQKKIDSEHKKGKLTARERIEYLLDKNTESIEIGALTAEDMYQEQGGCPSGGVVVVIGYVSGRQCMVIANDATVKAGAWFPITGKKNLRAQEIAIENKLPVIYLVDSAGVYLPMQDEIFPDKENFGRVFRNNAKLSSMGIPQIAAIMGSCVAGGAYLPIMSDETLGGAETQTALSGVCDYKVKDDKEALDTIKKLINKYGRFENAGFDRIKPKKPKANEKEIYGVFSSAKPYDVKEIIKRLVDDSDFTEYKEDYGQTIVCAYARMDGWSVGIVANQRSVVKSKKGEVQIGGVIYSDSADKAARFVMLCNQKKIPLVFLQDVTGFMVGSRSEHGGIIKDGAKLVNAVSNSTVPKFTVVTGNSYGAGNYAMCGKAYDPRLMLAWPSAKIAVMGADQAAKTILQMQMGSLEAKNELEISEEEKQKILADIRDHYNKTTTSYYAAARLWVDAVIDPLDTRKWISNGISAANNAPVEKFNVGVLQV